MTENLSSCKSPQQMFGAIAKSYYAEKMGIPKEKNGGCQRYAMYCKEI